MIDLYSDASLRVVTGILLIVSNGALLLRGYRLLNPVTIISVSFFVPMMVATLRLSDLQMPIWSDETYLVLYQGLAAWVLIPALLLFALPRVFRSRDYRANLANVLETRYGRSIPLIGRPFALVVIGAFLASNLIQAGTLLPLQNAELVQDIHTQFPAGLRLFTTQISAAVAFLFLSFRLTRNPVDLLLLAVLVVLPLTRGGRIDTIEAFVVALILNHYFPIVRMNWKRLPAFLAIAAITLASLVTFGTQRLNRFGQYELTYAEIIEWNGVEDDTDLLPTLYAYFPLSFENLDRFIRQRPTVPVQGAATMNWLLVGLIKLNFLFEDLADIQYLDLYSPVSAGATVPTAMAAFFLDFGAELTFVPLLAIVSVWVTLFVLAPTSLLFTTLLALVTSGIALSAFQPIIVSAAMGQTLLFVLLGLAVALDVRVGRWRPAL